MKSYLADEDGFNGTGSLFASAMIAGICVLATFANQHTPMCYVYV